MAASSVTRPVPDTQPAETVSPRGTPAIELRNLHRYFGKLKAVDAVSFCVWPGRVLGFIGPNGAGKTTTMRILATLDLPTAGDAFVHGYSVIDDPDQVRRILGFMPDSFGRYANMNVIEYLDFFARAYGFRGPRRRDAVEWVLTFTELDKLAHKAVDTLSKGMSQRLCLGRTLIHDPDVLVLDEPAAGLDPRARVEVRELIHLLAAEMNKTVLISSHILTELGEICDSAAIIEAGRIIASGTMDEIRRMRQQGHDRANGTALSVRVMSDADRFRRWLLQQAFVSGVGGSGLVVDFDFNGDDAEQHRLLKLMLDEGFQIVELKGRSETLEDTFMALTKGIIQ